MTEAERETLVSIAQSLCTINAHILFVCEVIQELSAGNDNVQQIEKVVSK